MGAGLTGKEGSWLSQQLAGQEGAQGSDTLAPHAVLGVQRTQACESLTCQTCRAGRRREAPAAHKEGLH